ncbi:MAG: hypothetical protein JST40_00685 [Armatimonadetes bacterium]|nr:hypothetical protein [Armatimonadota bacterium]
MDRKDRVVLALIAVGFLLTLIEVRSLHMEVVERHWEGRIPIVYSGLAILVSFLAMARSNTARMVAGIFFLIGIPIGLFGFWKHTDGDLSRTSRLFTQSTVTANAQERDDDDDERDRRPNPEFRRRPRRGGGGPPLLAPMGLSGLAAIGAAIVMIRRREEEEDLTTLDSNKP